MLISSIMASSCVRLCQDVVCAKREYLMKMACIILDLMQLKGSHESQLEHLGYPQTTSTMPFVAGISFSSLVPGSSIQVELLSPEDEKYTHTFNEKIVDDLTTSFKNILAAFKEKPAQIAVSLPIYFTETEQDAVYSAARAAGVVINQKMDHGQTILRSLVKEDYPAQNELVIDIGPAGAAARLVSTEVDESIRMSDVAKEIIVSKVDTDPSTLIAQLVEPALASLKAIPTVSGDDLKRIIVIDSLPNVVPFLVDILQTKFTGSSAEVLVKSKIALAAASIALYYYRDSIAPKYVFNVAPLRVGIAKSDGYVLTLLPRGQTLPNTKSAVLTTSKDNQTKVTVKIVVGASRKVSANTVIAELVLDGLAPRPKGVPHIRINLNVEQMGKTLIVVEDVVENGPSIVTKTVELKDITGDTMTPDDVEVMAKTLDTLEDSDKAEEAEARWVGEEVQGDLPE
ncbi:hypothetical protein B0H34DRAFT_712147 [Crassisporium funariophilum]|nr:hypothetical protein B0H34DRAFT_712147 [Crassisporium funariophilum]